LLASTAAMSAAASVGARYGVQGTFALGGFIETPLN
jgi:hypothetical protein